MNHTQTPPRRPKTLRELLGADAFEDIEVSLALSRFFYELGCSDDPIDSGLRAAVAKRIAAMSDEELDEELLSHGIVIDDLPRKRRKFARRRAKPGPGG